MEWKTCAEKWSSEAELRVLQSWPSPLSFQLTWQLSHTLKARKKYKKMVDSQFLSLASNGLHWPPFTILRSRCDYTFLFVEITFSANVEWPQIAFEATEVNVFFWPLMASIDLGVHLQFWGFIVIILFCL